MISAEAISNTPKKSKKSAHAEKGKFELDCSLCTNESLFSTSELKDFLLARMNLRDKPGKIDRYAQINTTDNTVEVEYKCFISKRYVKYLGRKFLRIKKLNSWVRIIASSKTGYKFVFYNVDKDNEE